MNRPAAAIPVASLTVATLVLAGCGGGGGDGPVEPNQAPEATITSPATGSSFDQGETVTFEGSASDPEDGSLDGGSLVWSSDLDGRLGVGTTVQSSDLSAGDHTITLEATDSDGATDTDQISIAVGSGGSSDRADLTVSRVAALPGGALTDQTVDVFARIRNAGGVDAGGFDWEVSVDGTVEGSGRVDALAAGDSLDLARVEDLGPFAEGQHTVRVEIDTGEEVDEGSEADNAAEDLLPVYTRGMDIELRYLTEVSDVNRASFRDAADRWATVVPGDLPDVAIRDTFDTSQCIESGPKLADEEIDDLLVLVRVDSIDGSGGTLARAGPCGIRTAGPGNSVAETIVIGVLEADSADIRSERSAGRLEDLLVHELAHVLGFGTLWRSRGFLADTTTALPYYTGRQAREGFVEVGGDSFDGEPVPVEGFVGGEGTVLGHWREAAFENELMTGFINAGDNPLSIVSVAAMGDLYLATDPGTAEAYRLPGSGTSASLRTGLGPASGWEARLPAPLFGIDVATGRVELLQRVRQP